MTFEKLRKFRLFQYFSNYRLPNVLNWLELRIFYWKILANFVNFKNILDTKKDLLSIFKSSEYIFGCDKIIFPISEHLIECLGIWWILNQQCPHKMIINCSNLLIQEVMTNEDHMLINWIGTSFTVDRVPVDIHLIFLVLYLELLCCLVGYRWKYFEILFIVVEDFYPAVSYLLEVVSRDGKLLAK